MPRKTIQERRDKKYVKDTKDNRIRPVLDDLIGIEDPDDLMQELLGLITTTQKAPTPGSFCIFVYNPKTLGIQYDEYPFVAVSDIYQWGFRGINFHWGEMRQYTWSEIIGDVHIVYPEEVRDLQALPFGKIRTK